MNFFFAGRRLAAAVIVLVPAGARAQRAEPPAAVRHILELVRPTFSGKNAYAQVAFMDQYFRWPEA